ncbi:hypothetical protein ACFW04_002478 [Cataglyphis niger]
MMDVFNVSKSQNICVLPEDSDILEDPRTPTLRRISYGIVLPTICCFGIIGNILNLVVLTRRNMRGTAYIYMRGVGVMMLLALTVERYVSVCHPGQHTRPLCGPPHLTVALIPLVTFFVYLPWVFRGEVTTCLLEPDGPLIYQKGENRTFLHSLYFQIYKIMLEVVFKVAPTILLAGFNLKIMLVYRRSCERRRRMTLSRTISNDEDPRTFAEERRLILLLGSTSILFLVCVSPMVILNVTLNESNLNHYWYQVFRALANLLEVINYSITFYIYCLFSEDFRNTLIRTLQWPWVKSKRDGRSLPMKRSPIPRPTTTTTTPPTTTVATPGHLARASV